DPDSTAASPASAESLPLRLAPYESRVFVFASSKAMPAPAAAGQAEAVDLSKAWTVNFPGIHKSADEPTLTDWISDPSTLHYSGEADYSRDVTLAEAPVRAAYLEIDGGKPLPGAPNAPSERGQLPETLGPDGLPNPLITRTGPGMHAYFDPPIREAALVTINGQPAGALWHPPYRLDVTQLLHAGANHVEIRV